MRIETRFSCGDKVWCVLGTAGVKQLIVGQVQAVVTDSPGRAGEVLFDNYRPQKAYAERYMCVETGIGGGYVFTLGATIFEHENEALSAVARAKETGV